MGVGTQMILKGLRWDTGVTTTLARERRELGGVCSGWSSVGVGWYRSVVAKIVEREPTAFERKVYDATQRIPRGKVTTYGEIAEEVGCGSSRAVGQALARNPYAPQVPCHRVIRADMTTGGFSGEKAGPVVRKKVRLLEREGVVFEEGRLREPGRLYRF